MTTASILFAGGSGNVGRKTITWLRARYPDVPVLIGGRNLETARKVAAQAGAAKAVAIDLDKHHLGLGDNVAVAAVIMLVPDNGLQGLRYAQDLGVPYLSIGSGLVEVGSEMAFFARRATAAPIVLASHWMAGAAMHLAVKSAKRFERIDAIRLGALVDDKETVGPTSLEDMARLHEAAPAALAYERGQRAWLTGDAVKSEIETVDGRVLAASAFSSFDVVSLHAATGAAAIRFDLVTAESSSRRGGGKAATEIMVEIDGQADGRQARTRATLAFEQGTASLTGLSVVLLLEQLLGLNGGAAVQAGLYMPELLVDANVFMDELARSGATITENAA